MKKFEINVPSTQLPTYLAALFIDIRVKNTCVRMYINTMTRE